jgi:ribonuclease VapC
MIVVDSSVVVAVVREERESAQLLDILDQTPQSLMSVVSYVETNMVIAGRRADADLRQVGILIKALGIEIVPVTLDQGETAVASFIKFGKGRHRARLNLADCFSYALAKTRELPLLFKGDDFLNTDVIPAWRP